MKASNMGVFSNYIFYYKMFCNLEGRYCDIETEKKRKKKFVYNSLYEWREKYHCFVNEYIFLIGTACNFSAVYKRKWQGISEAWLCWWWLCCRWPSQSAWHKGSTVIVLSDTQASRAGRRWKTVDRLSRVTAPEWGCLPEWWICPLRAIF